MIEINGIDAADADEAWTVVGPLLDRAMIKGNAQTFASSLLDLIKKDLEQLWVVRIDGEFVAAFVTQIDDYDVGRVLTVVAIGGERMAEWLGDVNALVHDFAAHHNCKFIASEGRSGWERALRAYGWRKSSVRMLKEI